MPKALIDKSKSLVSLVNQLSHICQPFLQNIDFIQDKSVYSFLLFSPSELYYTKVFKQIPETASFFSLKKKNRNRDLAFSSYFRERTQLFAYLHFNP